MENKYTICFQCKKQMDEKLWKNNDGVCPECEKYHKEDEQPYINCGVCGLRIHYEEWLDNGGTCCTCSN